MGRQWAGTWGQFLISHLTSLSTEETGLAPVSAPTDPAHSQGQQPPRRHLFQPWPPLSNENSPLYPPPPEGLHSRTVVSSN